MTAEQEQEQEAVRKDNSYRILRQDNGGDGYWWDLGVVEAQGVIAARREAVKQFGLEADVREGNVTLVVIANRFWRPSRGGVKTSEKIEFE